jgi:hypothetical protein
MTDFLPLGHLRRKVEATAFEFETGENGKK